MNDNEIRSKAQELGILRKQQLEINKKFKALKEEVFEHLDAQGMDETSWSFPEGFIEVSTSITYKLADLMPKVQIDIDKSILEEDKVEKFIEPKLKLSKEGKKRFKLGDEQLIKIMIPHKKKKLTIAFNSQV